MSTLWHPGRRAPEASGTTPRTRALSIALGSTALATTLVSVPLSLGHEALYDTVFYTLFGIVLALTGTLVANRARQNPIGWILLGMAVETGISESLEGWGERHELAGSDVAAWTTASLTYVGIGIVPAMLLVFPTGALPSSRWRLPFWLVVAAIPISAITSAFSHLTQRSGSTAPNPLALPGPFVDSAFIAVEVLLAIGLGVAIASLAVRYRRGTSRERQQLKWVGFSTALLTLLGPFAFAFYDSSVLVQIVIGVAVTLLPITIAIAILRYRLYDIDRIISRTTSWVIVTILIAGAYSFVVISVSAVLPTLPAVGVAVATLVAAGMFLPVLRRVRYLVDRRFDREAYDAAKVVEGFGERLRSGVDPQNVGAELISATERALHPVAVGLWIRRDAPAEVVQLADIGRTVHERGRAPAIMPKR